MKVIDFLTAALFLEDEKLELDFEFLKQREAARDYLGIEKTNEEEERCKK